MTEISEQELLHYLGAEHEREVAGEGMAQKVRDLIPASWRPWLRLLLTDAIAPWQRRKARELAEEERLQLHLGCGTLLLDDWVNVDLIGLPVDMAWNITRALPFPDNSVNAIFNEHVLEHLTPEDGYQFLKDAYRVLQPGGVLRVVMPDAHLYIKSYVDPEDTFLEEWRGVPYTPMMALQQEFYSFSHRAMYNYETLALFLETIGFDEVERSRYGESRLEPCPDSEWRVGDSFYAEAVV